MRKRLVKFFCYAVLLLAWLVLLPLGLEVWERYQLEASFAYVNPIMEKANADDMAVFDATAASAPRPPAEVLAKYPALEKLDNADDATLASLARQWEAIIIQCDMKGAVAKRYSADAPAPIAELAARAQKASVLADLVPKDDKTHWGGVEKLNNVMGQIVTHNPSQPYKDAITEFIIPVDCAPQGGFRFFFHPLPRMRDGLPLLMLVITQWRWHMTPVAGGGFRGNYYERDTYPAFKKSEFWTNSRGFRTREIAMPKPPGVYRIVCIGGSTTMEGPRNDLTYPVFLEQLLRSHFKTDAIEVFNCGIDGAPIAGILDRFDELFSYGPGIIVHYNYVNDTQMLLDKLLERTIMASWWRKPAARLLCKSKFVPARMPWLWDFVMPSDAEYRAQIEQDLMPPLKQMSDRCKQAGVRFAVASFAYPDFFHLPPAEREHYRRSFCFQQILRLEFRDYARCTDAYNALVRDFCAREGAIYVPCQENLKGGVALFLDHCHFHLHGLKQKAQVMFDTLKDVVAEGLKKTPQSPS